jgi:hypothetical protein
MARAFVLRVLATTLSLAAAVCALNAWVDPFQAYGEARGYAPRYYPDWQRFENPGIARHHAYDRVIAGSSLMQCMNAQEVDRALGGRTVNLALPAQTAYGAARLLEISLAAGKRRQVIMNLDYNAFSGAPEHDVPGAPSYLYDDTAWNDLPYLLSIETTAKSLAILLGIADARASLDPGSMWCWAGRRRFSAAEAVRGLDASDLNRLYHQPARTLEGMRASFEANLVPLIEAHPDVRFTFVLPPYSILVWCDFRQRGQLEVTLAFRDWLLRRTSAYANVELFDFQAEPGIVVDLANYTDFYHYSPQVANAMVAAIGSGHGRLTAQSLALNDAWLRRAATQADPALLIERARRGPVLSAPGRAP